MIKKGKLVTKVVTVKSCKNDIYWYNKSWYNTTRNKRTGTVSTSCKFLYINTFKTWNMFFSFNFVGFDKLILSDIRDTSDNIR